MPALRRYGLPSLGVAVMGVWLVGCGSSDGGTTNPASTPNAVVIVSGNNQVGLIGQALAAPLVVKVTNSAGAGVVGASVTFTVATGAASVSPATITTDASGQAQTQVTLGGTAGTIIVTATVANSALVATFAITAGSGSSAAKACSSSSPQAFTAGQVSPGVGGTGICLSGGATGSDFALIGFYGNPDSSQIQPLTVTSTNATAITTADLAPAVRSAFSLAPISVRNRGVNAVQTAFDAKLRAMERRDLAPKVAAARSWYRNANTPSGVRENAIPPTLTLGQIITLNANGNDPCTTPINVAARVAAIGTTSIIVADTTNPLPTFSDAEYQSFATMFDTLINPLDVSNFGQPTDIDKNGKIVILFTKEVNKLTPRNSGGLIGGFFDARDLFPTTANAQLGLPACATSNVGEMFYVLVPDSAGVYSNPQQKSDVLNVTPGTLAHEYQHLINAGRRLYINTNAIFPENDWLNEGLSHIAEELLFYRVTNLAPRQNITVSVLGANTTITNLFINYQGDNFCRYDIFLGVPAQTSVFSAVADTSLATRGAVWNMLRYLADHHSNGSSDTATWSSLVNTSVIGQENLANVFGPDYLTQIRDWATSVFSDDVPGVTDARFQEASWNMRDIWPHLSCGNGPPPTQLPLKVIGLADNAPVSTAVLAGGAAYIRFHVAAGASASIDWGTVSPLMQFTVVRSQ